MASPRLRCALRRVFAAAVAVVLAALGSAWWAPGTACACSCAALAPESLVAQAPAVVVGTPVAVEESGLRATYTVDVVRSYKQRVPRQITVDTASSSAACGLSLELNVERVLVLGGPTGGGAPAPADWTANLCWNLAGPEQIVPYAGASFEPLGTGNDDDPERFSAGMIAALLVGAVGAAALLAYAAWNQFRRPR